MESTTSKCVMVLDENLPLGLLANTAAILGITLGKHMPEAVGADVLDGSGKAHLGIIMFPVPILRGDAEQIRAIRETLYGVDYQDVIVVDFSDVAQCCKKLRRIHRQCGAGGRKRMAVFRPRPLRPQEAGQQTDRKYAAAAMRALVSLQMQGMPRAFEAFPAFFIWRSGARTFFQKSGEPFSHLFFMLFYTSKNNFKKFLKSCPILSLPIQSIWKAN